MTTRENLTNEDKLQLGRLTTKDDAGVHFYQRFEPDWLDRMEHEGLITIHRPIHDRTGIPYSEEYHTVEVSPEVADWFDDHGELIEG